MVQTMLHRAQNETYKYFINKNTLVGIQTQYTQSKLYVSMFGLYYKYIKRRNNNIKKKTTYSRE